MNREQIEITFNDGTSERHTIGGLVDSATVAEGCLALWLSDGVNPLVHIGTFPIHNIRKWVVWSIK